VGVLEGGVGEGGVLKADGARFGGVGKPRLAAKSPQSGLGFAARSARAAADCAWPAMPRASTTGGVDDAAGVGADVADSAGGSWSAGFSTTAGLRSSPKASTNRAQLLFFPLSVMFPRSRFGIEARSQTFASRDGDLAVHSNQWESIRVAGELRGQLRHFLRLAHDFNLVIRHYRGPADCCEVVTGFEVAADHPAPTANSDSP